MVILKKGHRGENVRQLQGRLNAAGYPVVVDGVFGNETENAVRQVQNKYGLTVNGIAGPVTLRKLEEIYAYSTGASSKQPSVIVSGMAPERPGLSPIVKALGAGLLVFLGFSYFIRR